MAVTPKTWADLLSAPPTGLATNILELIEGDDLLSGLLSIRPNFGLMYFSTPAATSPAGAGTFLKAAGTTTLVGGGSGVDMPANNRLRNTSAITREFIFFAAVSMTSATASGKELSMSFAKNGTNDANYRIDRRVSSTDVGAAAVLGQLSLAQNDYGELWVANQANTDNLTIEFGVILALGLLVA
jgi:hypothetical protein